MSFSTGKKSMSKAVSIRSEEAQLAKSLANNLIFTFFRFAGMICAVVGTGCVKVCKSQLNEVGVDRWLSYNFLEAQFLAKVRGEICIESFAVKFKFAMIITTVNFKILFKISTD
jgi:hypothetical protein